MNRARWTTAALILCALWLLGALVMVPRMQERLAAASRHVLDQQATLGGRLSRLQLDFDGQTARLAGQVRTIQDRLVIEAAVRDLVRAPAPWNATLGMRFNPVSHVRNDIEVAPYPAGWMLLATDGKRARLSGSAASEFEARDLARSIQEIWNSGGGVAQGMPATDPAGHDEASNVVATLRGVPAPQGRAEAWLARIGQAWAAMPLLQSDDVLKVQAMGFGVSEAEWREQILPEVKRLRSILKQQQADATEQARLAALPRSHLFIAARGRQVILCGEVSSPAVKRALLDETLRVLAPRRVLDELRVNEGRRPEDDFPPVTSALVPPADAEDGKTFFLGISGEAWKPVDWQVAATANPWKDTLPPGLDAALLEGDSARLINWLQGSDRLALPAGGERLQPSVITLALFGSKAILSGQVAEEAVRAQVIAAARLAYAPAMLVVHDDFVVRGSCRPAGEAFQTTLSLPPAPAAGAAGLFAVAVPGGTWTVLPVSPALVEAGGLRRAGLPEACPPLLVEACSAEAIEQLRLHLSPRPAR